MNTETRPQVIEFSSEVREMASALARLPGCFDVVYAICRSGRDLRILEQHRVLGIAGKYAESLPGFVAAECETQAILKKAGITDDKSAIACMDEVRPTLGSWGRMLSEIKERHQEEIREFLASIAGPNNS